MNNCKTCNKELKNKKRTYCSNVCKFSDKEYNLSRVSDKKNTGKFELLCRLCGWKTHDEQNKSGAITRHLLSHKIRLENNSISDYFDIVSYNVPKKLQCPLCDWNTNDTFNKSGIFTVHLNRIHNLTISEFLNSYSDFNHLWKTYQNRQELLSYIMKNNDNGVECKICNKKLKVLTNSHLKKHNTTTDEYKEKYNTELLSKSSYKTFIDNLQKVEFEYSSKAEKEILEFLNENNITDVVMNSKKYIPPFELDLYIPSKSAGIEFDGLFFHCELSSKKNSKYHLDKTNLAEKNGIRLIHVFEDEWNRNKELVKSKLLHILNISKCKKIYARNCKIGVPTSTEKSLFLKDNHIQGNDKSSIFIGLYYLNNLVSIATFGNKRLALGNSTSNDGEYELIRFCCDKNFICVGAFSKLLSHFVKKYLPKKIISYADRRYSNNSLNIYNKCGFKFVGVTKPNYWYVKKYKERLHRFTFTKHRLVKMGHDKSKTEWQIMQELGYDRIWDCGHLKYEWMNNKTKQ